VTRGSVIATEPLRQAATLDLDDHLTKPRTLSEISAPVDRELKEFNKRFSKTLISDVPLVNLVAKYIVRTKGKQLRPMLVLLAAEACGGVNDATYRAALLVEILHTATLVHDDVIDDADLRRGFKSIKALWKNKVGVLMGDYLLAKGLLLTVESGEYHFLQITSHAVRRMSEGELYQMQKARQLNIDEAGYFRIISDKTASLISTCCEMGAVSALGAGDSIRREALKTYGEAIGVAFQIRDDLFDYENAMTKIGKPTAIDLKEKKLTLPLIYALSQADQRTAKRMRQLVRSGKAANEAYNEVIDFVMEHRGIEYARTKAEEYAQTALRALEVLPASDAKNSLQAFVRFVMERES
jgi:octaprenyl-diphosphate synthase